MQLIKDTKNRDLGYKKHKCRICCNEGYFQTYLVREMFYGTKEEFEYFACPNCNCLQISEIPDDLGKYYEDGYYSFSLQDINAGEEELAPATHHEMILDVGCGSGQWLIDKAKDGYDNLYGCDPFIESEKSYFGRVTIYKSTIHEIPGEKRFDLIKMADSLEHMTDPEAALKSAARLLKDDGTIEISVPAWPNFTFDMFGAHWIHLDAPRHMWIPSADAMEYIAERAGLKIRERECDSNEGSVILSFLYQHGIPMSEMTDEIFDSCFSKNDRRAIREAIFDANCRGEGDHAVYRLVKSDDKTAFDDLKAAALRIDRNNIKYEISKQIEELVETNLLDGRYEDCYAFLRWLFFESAGQSKAAYLSEGTMLQYMMLEISFLEKNAADQNENVMNRYVASYKKFEEAYLEIKHAIRRVWFELSDADCAYLSEMIAKYEPSPECLAVIAKYSIPEENWVDAFEKITNYLTKQNPEKAKAFVKYNAMIPGMTERPQVRLNFGLGIRKELEFQRIYLDDASVCPDEGFLAEQEKDENTIAVIFCSNDQQMEEECLVYLRYLDVPAGMNLKVYSIWNAKGMCYGYNRAMYLINARYKIYIHHDSFLIKKDILLQIVQLFESDSELKLLGIAGSIKMSDRYYWGAYDSQDLRLNLYQDRGMETVLSRSLSYDKKTDDAKAIDGVMIATSTDILWREDIFDEWHFYDISQCYEFRKRGYKTALINDDSPWMLHETTLKRDPKERYEYYGEIFKKEYLD
ncbi:MAG: methyltransferase domain-containing protein, partial [Lachnospiraceae bacterium]|nr:methyltransferase domain-containing protein [Lachnospiraceae bacterium]